MSRTLRFERSIRFRITAPSVLIVGAIVAVLAFSLVQSVQSHLLSEVDRGLVSGAAYVRTERAEGHLIPATSKKGDYGQFFLANGTLVGSSENLRGAPPLLKVTANGPTPFLTTISTRRYGEMRVLVEQLGRGSAPILVIAEQIDQITNATNSLAVGMAIVGPLVVLMVAVLIWLVVGRAMKPVEFIRIAVADISDDNLADGVSNPETGDELERLVLTLNSLLQRLGSAIEREQRLVADASHELRSPIANIRAVLESGGSNPADFRAMHRAALGALQRLENLAEQLLTLDGVGRGQSAKSIQTIDVDELVFSQAEQLQRTTDLVIDVSAVSGGQVLGSEIDVMRVVENLASNAVRHAEEKIAFSVVEKDGWVELGVTDDGPGVPDDGKAVIFERFRRLDSDRGRLKGGSGLGLAIVWEIATNYEGVVRVEDAPGGGARFVVALPASTTVPH